MACESGYTFIDLFAGLGGFHLALGSKARCVFASEWDTYARETYNLNFGSELTRNCVPFVADITKVQPESIPEHTILCGGFPCQPFSIAGSQKGFQHATQGTLFFNVLNIVKCKKPRVVFLENVANLLHHDRGRTFTVIRQSLEAEGYTVMYEVLNGYTHGDVPQNRARVFIVAFRDAIDASRFSFPSRIPLTTTVLDVVDHATQEPRFYQTNLESAAVRMMRDGVVRKGTIYQFRRRYLRENKHGLCPTLTANMGGGGHNVPLLRDNHGVRKLTPRECLRFQGYPDSYRLPPQALCHLYKQAGNSVVVPVVERIAENIMATLLNTDKESTRLAVSAFRG